MNLPQRGRGPEKHRSPSPLPLTPYLLSPSTLNPQLPPVGRGSTEPSPLPPSYRLPLAACRLPLAACRLPLTGFSSQLSALSSQLVQRTPDPNSRAALHVGIDLRGGHVLVAQ